MSGSTGSELDVRELTPPGRGAVSVLAVRGAGALEHVRRLAPDARLTPGRPVLVRLAAAGETLDEALIVVIDEREVELHLHGSPLLVRRLATELGALDRTPADPASLAVERAAEERLESARCDAAARVLLDQAEGALRRALAVLLAADEDARRRAIDALLERGRVAQRLFDPLSIVIAGPVNAGKSTLFNALFGERRVVTSEEPGTTRDWIREPAELGGYPVWLSDTAGERALAGDPAGGMGRAAELERSSQVLARIARERADLVLWLDPLDRFPEQGRAPEQERAPVSPSSHVPAVRWLGSRADLAAPGHGGQGPSIAALSDPEGARRVVAGLLREVFDLPEAPWQPGRATPFLASQLALLERLRDERDPALRGSLARALLDGA